MAARANHLATKADGNVQFHPQAEVQAIERLGPDRYRVQAICSGKATTLEAERVIANVGYSPDASYTESCRFTNVTLRSARWPWPPPCRNTRGATA